MEYSIDGKQVWGYLGLLTKVEKLVIWASSRSEGKLL